MKAGLGYTVGNILVNGIAFLSIPIFTRLLSTGEFGVYSSFMTYQGILAMVIGCTLHTSLKNAKYDYPEERDQYHSSLLLLMLLLFGFFLLLGFVFRNFWGSLLSLSPLFVVPLVMYSFSSALMLFFNAELVLNYRYKPYLTASLLFSVSSILLSVFFILVCFPGDRAYGRILGGVIPISLVGCYILWFYFRKQRPKVRRDYWSYGLKISLPLIPHGLSQLILTQFDRVMILRIIGNSAAGIYSLAYTLATVLQIIFSSLDSIWTTWFFEKMSKNDVTAIRNKSRYYVLFVSLLTVMFFLVVPEVIKLFSGRSYWDAMYVVIPVCLSIYFSFLYYFPAGVEYYHKKTVFIAIGTMSAAAFNVLLNLWCIPRYGYTSAAYTTVASYLLYFIFHLLIVWKIERRFVFDLSALLYCLIGTSLCAVFVQIFINFPMLRWGVFILLLSVCAVAAYRKRSVLLKFLKKESVDEI